MADASLVASFALVSCAQHVASRSTAAPAARMHRIQVPTAPVVRSLLGVARADVYATLSTTNLMPAFTYRNETGAGPTIRVRPGDRIAIDYHDALPSDNRAGNATNLHFHGLVTAPVAPGDEVLKTMVYPGDHFRYDVLVGKTQEPGLYWYHPHVHGDTYRQVGLGGMSGAIVVEGIAHYHPELARMPERILVLRDVFDDGNVNTLHDHPFAVPNDPDGKGANTPCAPIYGHHLTLNGAADPQIPVGDGGPQFIRFLNATGSRTLDLSIPGARLRMIELDGVPLDAYPRAPASEVVSHAIVPPGARVEFVAEGLAAGMRLQSACYDAGPDGDGDPAATLASFVPGVDAASQMLARYDAGASVAPGVLRRTLPKPANRRTIVLTETNVNADSRFAIDGRSYAMGDPPLFTATSGTIEAWTVVNKSREMHDFHIHQVHFAVTSVDGRAPSGPRVWHDSFPVPPASLAGNGTLVPSRTNMLVDFRDPVVRGTFALHCHLLDHEDAGMMATIAVR